IDRLAYIGGAKHPDEPGDSLRRHDRFDHARGGVARAARIALVDMTVTERAGGAALVAVLVVHQKCLGQHGWVSQCRFEELYSTLHSGPGRGRGRVSETQHRKPMFAWRSSSGWPVT